MVINPTDANGKLIFPAGDTNTDVILINYGASSALVGKGTPVTDSGGVGAAAAGASVNNTINSPNVNDYEVAMTTYNNAGFHTGDLYLAVPAIGDTQANHPDCVTGEVTSVLLPTTVTLGTCEGAMSPPATNIYVIGHQNAGYNSFDAATLCGAANATWNKTGGPLDANNNPVLYRQIPPPYCTTCVSANYPRLYDLGSIAGFVSRVYAVRDGNLTVCDVATLGSECTDASKTGTTSVWQPITYGIVSLQAQYGKDTTLSGTANTWDTTTLTGANVAQVTMIRLALVARSSQCEKTVVTGGATGAPAPVWNVDATGTTAANIDVSKASGNSTCGTNWQYYRYKTVQSIVPLRNLIWGEQK